MIAKVTKMYDKIERDAKLDMKVSRVTRVVYYACAPRLPAQPFLLEFSAIGLGHALFHTGTIGFKRDGPWREDEAAFRFEEPDFMPAPGAAERLAEYRRQGTAELLGEMKLTVDEATETVRRMSSSRRDREAPASCETVRHIIKFENAIVKAELDAKLDEIDTLNKRVGALEEKLSGMSAKVDDVAVGMNTVISKLDRALSRSSRN